MTQHAPRTRWRNDRGVGLTGVIVSMIIVGILAVIGGPRLWGLITDAREFSLHTTVRQAAETMRDRLTLDPALAADMSVAANKNQLETALLNEYDLDWQIRAGGTTATEGFDFDSPGSGEETTMIVEFVEAGATPTEAKTTKPPIVDWLSANYRAVRMQAQNPDGAWACALLVLRPAVDADYITTTGATTWKAGLFLPTTTPAGLTSAGPTEADAEKINVWLSGIWYDSGEETLGSDSHHACSPVHTASVAGASVAYAQLPISRAEWNIGEPGTGGTGGTADTVVRTLRDSF